ADLDFRNLRNGENCHIGRQVFLDLANSIDIGDRVTISMRTTILTHTDIGDSRCGLPRVDAKVTIGDDVYIGAGAMLLPGVNLGPGSIVAAGAVVTRDVAPGVVVAGSPARPLTSADGQPWNWR
ncbi:MAG: acyltransferase, partial [Alphaproteobacteria bacterium]|nr:acyltransferase [Alphaproteobacteria bacterium]